MMFRSFLIVMVFLLLGWHKNLYAKPSSFESSVVEPQKVQPVQANTGSTAAQSTPLQSSTNKVNPITDDNVALLNNALYFILVFSALCGIVFRWWLHQRQQLKETRKGLWAAFAVALVLLWTPITISNLINKDFIYGYYGSHCFQEITDSDGNFIKGIYFSAECANERERTSALFIKNALSTYKSQLGSFQQNKFFGLFTIWFFYSVILCFWVTVLYYLLIPCIGWIIRKVDAGRPNLN